MEARRQKQLIIGGAYALIVAAVGFSVYWTHYRPTCSDGVMNGREDGIDCGVLACGQACPAPVQALVVKSVQLAKTPAGDFDAAVELYNPNPQYGVSFGSYDLVVRDTAGNKVASRGGNEFYMLPGQTKYMAVTSVRNIPDDAVASAEIRSITWEKVSGDPVVKLTVVRQALTSGAGQSFFETVFANNSDFDFDSIDVGIVVFDNAGDLITTNTTNFQTFLSQTQRSVKVSWPFPIPADARVYVEVGTNVFDNANFIKRNGTQEKFQQYF